jgi:hypothetical protein
MNQTTAMEHSGQLGTQPALYMAGIRTEHLAEDATGVRDEIKSLTASVHNG